MATKFLKKNELKFEDFEPVSELQELPEKCILLVTIPGFRKEDFRVQVDAVGNLSVKGQKQIDNKKGKRFNKVFQLPQDSDIEKIRGKFEGEVLTLTVPRREKILPSNQEVKSSSEEVVAKSRNATKDSEKKEEETKPKEEIKPNDSAKKEEETKPKEEPKQTSDKKDEEVKPKEAKTDNKVEEDPKTSSEKIEELSEKKEEKSMPDIKEAASKINDEEPKTSSEKIEELSEKKEEKSMPDIKEAASKINDVINKWKQNNISDENKESTTKRERNKTVSWKERISQEVKDWSDYATLDNMLEVINRNKKEILVGVAAFSIGVLVYQKFCSRK